MMMLKKSEKLSTLVIKAEILFTKFSVEHNCLLSIMDPSSKLFKVTLLDSAICQENSCAHAKTTLDNLDV